MKRYKRGVKLSSVFSKTLWVIGFAAIVLMLDGCKSYEAPELKAIKDIRLRTIGGDQVELYAKLVFFNPNDVKFKLKSYHINVFIDDKKITELKDNTKRIIYPEKDFEMNAVAVFSFNDFEGNIITSAIGLLSKRMQLRFEGNIKLSRNGVSLTIPVNQKEKVKF